MTYMCYEFLYHTVIKVLFQPSDSIAIESLIFTGEPSIQITKALELGKVKTRCIFVDTPNFIGKRLC